MKVRVDILTDGSGDYTVNTPLINGVFSGYSYEKSDTAQMSADWDLTVVGYSSGVEYVNDTAMSNADHQHMAAEGSDRIVAREMLVVTVANGGSAKEGVLHLYFEED